PGEWHHLKPEPDMLGKLVGKGIPMSLQMLIMSATGVVMISFVNLYGARTTAAYGAAGQLWTYIQMPAIGIGAAVSSMNAQNVGAGRWDRVTTITLTAVAYGLAITGALTVLTFGIGDYLLGWFLPDDPEALGIASHMNLIILPSL